MRLHLFTKSEEESVFRIAELRYNPDKKRLIATVFTDPALRQDLLLMTVLRQLGANPQRLEKVMDLERIEFDSGIEYMISD